MPTYYRGSPECKFKQFSYFTKYCPEAELYATEFYEKGELCEALIEPENPLYANDIWDAGQKLGVKEMLNKTKQRLKILNKAAEKGFDSIVMNSWLVVLNPNIVKFIKKIEKCPSKR